MKRRTFTMGLGAAFASPALPALPISAATNSAALEHFKAAKLIARAHNQCSIDMLARLLRVDQTLAGDIQRILLERGVITPPVAGISMAVNPINTHCVPIEALKPTNLSQSVSSVRAKVAKLKELREELEATVPLEEKPEALPEEAEPVRDNDLPNSPTAPDARNVAQD